MPQIKDFNAIKSEKLYKEIRELGEAQDKATDELEAILNRMDLKSANGVKTSEEDVLAMFSAMGKVARANRERHEACINHPNYKPITPSKDIEEEVNKVIHGHVIPAFVPENELDDFFQNE